MSPCGTCAPPADTPAAIRQRSSTIGEARRRRVPYGRRHDRCRLDHVHSRARPRGGTALLPRRARARGPQRRRQRRVPVGHRRRTRPARRHRVARTSSAVPTPLATRRSERLSDTGRRDYGAGDRCATYWHIGDATRSLERRSSPQSSAACPLPGKMTRASQPKEWQSDCDLRPR